MNYKVKKSIYERGTAKYMDIIKPNDEVMSVKVPFRYKRVDCEVKGLTPVQDLKEGDTIEATIVYCGRSGDFQYWKFSSIEKV